MARDIFNDAEDNFKNAEQTMTAFWNMIKPPFIWVFNKIVAVFENVFESKDETTKYHLNKLPF